MLKVGIIGTGNISRSHIQGYLEYPDECEIVAVCDISPRKAEDKKTEFSLGAAQVYDSHAAMLAAEELDLVSVCTPPPSHAPITIDCLMAGVNVLCEKPMAPSLEECDAMLAAQEESGKVLSIVAQNRFRDDMSTLKEAIDSGIMGRLTHMQVNSSWWRGRPYYDLWWRGTWASEGGGCTLNHAVHHVDLALWMMGRPNSVTAVLANTMHDNSEVEDLSMSIWTYDRALAEMTASVVDHGEEQSIIIDGEFARVCQPWHVVAETSQPNGFPMPGHNTEVENRLQQVADQHKPLPYEGHTGQIGDVLAALHDGRRPAIDGVDGRNAIELITAIYESGTKRCTVDLPLRHDDPYYQRGKLPTLARHFYEKENSVEDQGGFIVVEGSPDPAQR